MKNIKKKMHQTWWNSKCIIAQKQMPLNFVDNSISVFSTTILVDWVLKLDFVTPIDFDWVRSTIRLGAKIEKPLHILHEFDWVQPHDFLFLHYR